jgi:peptidoglycan-associated lipoprotein
MHEIWEETKLKQSTLRSFALVFALSAIMLLGACHKKAAPPPPPPAQPSMSDEEMFAQNVKDIYFDYDKSDIRADEQATIQADASFLQQHPNISLTVEGHCDERGSTEYNLALGDNRASSVKNALVSAGVSADRIKTVSYGKEKPFCTEHNEQCWQQNRRGHLVYSK